MPAVRFPLLQIAALTAGTFLLHGYHPFADDADIYASSIEKLADPSLFRPDAAFVLASTKLSVFARLMAFVLRHCGISIEALLLVCYAITMFAFLCAAWGIAHRTFRSVRAQWFAVTLAAALFALPVAGTALVIMDPYVTSRSVAVPLGLFALRAAMDKRWMVALGLILTASVMHPLMGAYAGIFVALYSLLEMRRKNLAILLAGAIVAAAGVTWLATRHVAASPAYEQAIHHGIRTFLFPSQWRWYEDAGLLIPLILLGAGAFLQRNRTPAGRLCTAAVLSGSSCAVAAFLFVPVHGPYLLTRLQPLRGFLMVYAVGALLMGGFLGDWLLRPAATLQGRMRHLLALALLVAAVLAMYLSQLSTYPASAHLELPGTTPRNPWQQAFRWIARNTPADAVFAADPGMAFTAGEDSQGFRATTRRSLLPNDKDEGIIVAAAPQLAELWVMPRNAQVGINKMTDEDRRSHLRPLGADWIVLSANAATALDCPYRNPSVQVCKL